MKLTHGLRVIHRDLGFLAVGITLVYGISGVILNHLGQNNPAFHTEAKTIQLPVNLSESELSAVWNADRKLPSLKRIRPMNENRLRVFLDGGMGVYNSSTLIGILIPIVFGIIMLR